MKEKDKLGDFNKFALEIFTSLKCISDTLIEAIKYSFFSGGKRVRAQFVYAIGEAFEVANQDCHKLAFAIEAIHTYSLIHDDLPAMDNDTIRRGKPTCHIRFNEATAILAGDALQALAFQIIQTIDVKNLSTLKKINTHLAQFCGLGGMVAGQQLDIEGENKLLTLDQLECIHIHKTAKMFSASILLPYFLSTNNDNAIEKVLDELSLLIGLCFQVKDDILDVTKTTRELGKTCAKDIDANKSTYVSLIGLERATNYLDEKKALMFSLINQLKAKNINCNNIEKLINLVIDRNY
ncbi:polyprenyl synthetase family protein [Allofrancisella guangzhouensis]|uniref:Octaprenyl-diphosphate synthase n=1 Tax=Allofrancisella guangzhouensis TaxID=594679 RepID=A0A0A8E5W8_9GAMM|nr:farnesyl diphosphate synthase [Allofrancisella guangzhouensis]AJC49374.1 octaprenyl-diphosphate synthase [Allofrancisella guangzhouensis]MBK2026984.1 polyprenyl synthetase family protein [Allofrancisella guangzhouensis]MBK2043892.1 polyprenyl synthetase family protein [Allofrancisella guangzhouensis]MBK2044995.1 polyprenyl synthetase family protein [Allofrancisella guangzhouensis]